MNYLPTFHHDRDTTKSCDGAEAFSNTRVMVIRCKIQRQLDLSHGILFYPASGKKLAIQ